MWDIKVVSRAKSIDISVWGGGFLYKMVRSIAGALIGVGEEDRAHGNKGDAQGKKRTERVVSAPAKGCVLKRFFTGTRY